MQQIGRQSRVVVQVAGNIRCTARFRQVARASLGFIYFATQQFTRLVTVVVGIKILQGLWHNCQFPAFTLSCRV